ncbi:hypothetical protein FQZ97_951040 [compost metagenome]
MRGLAETGTAVDHAQLGALVAVARFQPQHAALRHGLDRVDQQVDDDLLQFLAVAAHAPCTQQVTLDLDLGLRHQMSHQHQAVVDRAVEVKRLHVTSVFGGSRVLQQLGDDQAHAFDLLVEQLQFATHRLRVRAQGLAHQVEVALHHRNRVVDLVGDAGGELADGRELFAFDQLLLRHLKRLVAHLQLARALGHLVVELLAPAPQRRSLVVDDVQQFVQMTGECTEFVARRDITHTRL